MARLGALKDFGKRNRFPLALLGIVALLMSFAGSRFSVDANLEPASVGVPCTVVSSKLSWTSAKHVIPKTYNYSSRFKYENMTTDFVQIIFNEPDDSIRKTEASYGVGTNHTCVYQRRVSLLEYDKDETKTTTIHVRHPKLPQSEVIVLALLGFCGLAIILYIYDSERNRRKNFVRFDTTKNEFKRVREYAGSDTMSARTDDDDNADDDTDILLMTALEPVDDNKSINV